MDTRTNALELTDHFKLRMPSDLSEKLKVRAAANRRSLNSEILACLEKVVASREDERNGAAA